MQERDLEDTTPDAINTKPIATAPSATDGAGGAGTAGPPHEAPAVPAAAAPPGHELINPFARYGALEGSSSFFNGDHLRLDQKLGWVRGQNKEPVDTAQGYVTNMMEARHGYVKFARSGEGRAEHDVCLIREQPELPSCKSCGRSVREHDEHPKRCDWRPTVYLPLRSLDDAADAAMCFTGTGKGARVAVAELCKVYGRPGADRGGRDFVVMLTSRSFPNTEGGTTVWPIFKGPIGYEYFVPNTPAPAVEPVVVPIAPAGKAAKALPKRGDNLDDIDDIPFE